MIVCKGVYFLPGKEMNKKERSCFFISMVALVLQETKCPQKLPLEAPHSCKVAGFSYRLLYTNQITMKFHRATFFSYFSNYLEFFS